MCALKEECVLSSWLETFSQRLWKLSAGFFVPTVRSGFVNIKMEMKGLCSVLLLPLWSPDSSSKLPRLKWHKQVRVPFLTPGITTLRGRIPLGKSLEITQQYLSELTFNSLFLAFAASVVPGIHPLKKYSPSLLGLACSLVIWATQVKKVGCTEDSSWNRNELLKKQLLQTRTFSINVPSCGALRLAFERFVCRHWLQGVRNRPCANVIVLETLLGCACLPVPFWCF